jgi:thiamine-monophosphate kinase
MKKKTPSRARKPSFGEHEAVQLLLARFKVQKSSAVLLGIGDDAAVIAPPAGKLVLTVDTCLEGAHFERHWLALSEVGWKAFHSAASDLAAMGARPVAALSSLELPAGFAARELNELSLGQAAAARALRCPIVGGNLSRGSRLSLTTTVIGVAQKPVTRAKAKRGDELWLVGEVGLARAGLELLRRQRVPKKLGSREAEGCLRAFRQPVAMIDAGAKLASRATAMLDVSDGLSIDAGRLAEASGVRCVIEETSLHAALAPDLSAAAAALGLDLLDLALDGGEDYALLAAGPSKKRPQWARRIGRLERGTGVCLETPRGKKRELSGGFDHLLRR